MPEARRAVAESVPRSRRADRSRPGRDGPALVTVIPTADGSSAEGRATLDRIRAAAPAGVTIGGQAAQSADFVDAVYGKFRSSSR